MRHLAEAWLRTAARLGARDDVAGAGADLLSRYADPRRGYHNLTHLDDVLRNVDELAEHADDPDLVRLAAWFHDAVYEPAASDNEDRSAALAETVLRRLRMGQPVIEEVGRLVRSTRDHDPASDDSNGAVLSDADLAILASNIERYAEYTSGVRREYADVSDADFARGRIAVLRRLLDRPALFRTPSAHASWETTARANVAAEIERLTSDT